MAEHLSMPAPDFAEEVISSAHTPLSWVLLGNTATRCSCSSAGHMCLGDTLHSGWGYNSAPVLNVGKLGIRAGKILHLRNQIRQSCTPTSFLFRVRHPLYSVDSEAAGWDYFLGTIGMNLFCRDLSSGCCKLLPPSLSQSDSQGLTSADTPAGPMRWEQNRGSHDEMTHNLGVGPHSLFLTGLRDREMWSIWYRGCFGLTPTF